MIQFLRLLIPDRRFRFLLLAALTTAILWLSLHPRPPRVDLPFWGWDKAQHALAFGILTWMAGGFFRVVVAGEARAWRLAAIYALLLGGLVEVLQGLLPTGRYCELADLLADGVGVGLALVGIYGWRRFRWR